MQARQRVAVTSLAERFWHKVDAGVSGLSCWEWTAAKSSAGYGQIRHAGRALYAHRLSYELLVGPIPSGMVIDHLCMNRGCVNPDHMEPVTRGENVRRGRGGIATAIRAKSVTHCPQGHEYTEENTRVGAKNDRRCLACGRMKAHVRRARARAEKERVL